MASIIPGFEYDIFISYRQKDNKGDRWVSEFVEALKTELASTFKEDISIYFDVNPHDGLLETHDVDASLKEKLKCLVFIPVLSRTYCDPKSFAWENEFVAFAEQASIDKFGLKVRLPNGNFGGRILPVRIHDLDKTDIELCESVTGGAIHDIEFIYKSEGINRPLRSKEEKPDENFNNTVYHDQVNKTAMAVREIILGLKGEPDLTVEKDSRQKEQDSRFFENAKPVKSKKLQMLAGTGILAALLVAAIIFIPRLTGGNNLSRLVSGDGRVPIAIMPFQNMTNDTLWDVWQDGIQNIVITNLSNSEYLKVRQTGTITDILNSEKLTNYASLTPSVAGMISKKLETNVFITGSIKLSGSTVRLNAQLIDTRKGESLRSFNSEGIKDSILQMIDSLSRDVQDFLLISVMKKKVTPDVQSFYTTKYPEAYRYFLYGINAGEKEDDATSVKMFIKSIEIDTNFTTAMMPLSVTYWNMGLFDKGKEWCLKAYSKRDQMTMMQRAFSNYQYADYFETPVEQIKFLKQLKEIDPQRPNTYGNLGGVYSSIYQYDKVVPELEGALEIYKRWDVKDPNANDYILLGLAYHKTSQFKKEKKLYKLAENDFPEYTPLLIREAILSLTEGDTLSANKYIEKYKSVRKANSASEASILTGLGTIYSEAGLLDKAENFYRQALLLTPENPARLQVFARFLITNDLHVNEGMALIDEALKLKPDDYWILDCKGFGLYKQGKFTESLAVLEKSWALKPIYDHDVFVHLEEVKKAVAGLK